MRFIAVIILAILMYACGSQNKQNNKDNVNDSIEKPISQDIIPENITEERSSVIACNLHDSLLLIDLYNYTAGENWSTPWNLSKPVQTWFGIELDDQGRVEAINLPDNNLVGELPYGLEKLGVISSFNLSGNDIYGQVYIPESIHYEEDTIYTMYSFNDIEPYYTEDQIRPERYYNYSDEGLDIYIDPSMSRDAIHSFLEPGEEVYLLEGFIPDHSFDAIYINGFYGQMIPLLYDYDTMFIFSGFLSIIPYSGFDNSFNELLRLKSSFQKESGYDLSNPDYPVYEEMSSGETVEFYESGIIRIKSHEYEGGGESISFPKDKFSFQEVYLFANAYYNNIFSDKIGDTLPDKPLNLSSQDFEYYETIVVEMDETTGRINKIEISGSEPGYVEEYFIIESDQYIEAGFFGGS